MIKNNKLRTDKDDFLIVCIFKSLSSIFHIL